MIKTLKFYIKMIYKILKRETVGEEEYRQEYDKVAETYSCWLEEMGKYTNRIINTKYISKIKSPKILDFACGTGYITRRLLKEKNMECNITAVDISEDMLKIFKQHIDKKVNIVNSHGIEFLKNANEKYDAIYCGWALPYFDHKELLKLFKDVLNNNGIIAVIANSEGTLHRIENIFLNVMKENQDQVTKPMDIKFNLPNGKEELKKWFKKFGFEPLELEEEEVIFTFDTPEELHNWIVKTGAVAGTAKIFKDYDSVKEKIIKEIEREKLKDGKYTINHKFVYGIFKSN